MQTHDFPEDAIHASKAAQLLHCHVSQIHRLVLGGQLPGWKVKSGLTKARLFVSKKDVLNRITLVEVGQPATDRPRVQQVRRFSPETEAGLRRHGMI